MQFSPDMKCFLIIFEKKLRSSGIHNFFSSSLGKEKKTKLKTRKPIAKIKQQKNEHLPTEQNINSTIKYTKNKITNQIQPKPTKTIQVTFLFDYFFLCFLLTVKSSWTCVEVEVCAPEPWRM
jgi:hypothetical protein